MLLSHTRRLPATAPPAPRQPVTLVQPKRPYETGNRVRACTADQGDRDRTESGCQWHVFVSYSLQPALDNLDSHVEGGETAEVHNKAEVTKGLLHTATKVLHIVEGGLF